VSAPALVPGPLYGLRTWVVVGGRLAGPQRGTPWPPGGESLVATCDQGHSAPGDDCECGIHGWHPSTATACRVLGRRGLVAGVVEATGPIELHRNGFRAERVRPYALFAGPRFEPVARAYGAELVELRRPREVVEWCRARGLGLEPAVVDELLGAERVAAARRAVRVWRLRIVAWLTFVALLLAIGLIVSDDPGDRPLNGRTGEIRQR
jgi:hypothetical protein